MGCRNAQHSVRQRTTHTNASRNPTSCHSTHYTSRHLLWRGCCTLPHNHTSPGTLCLSHHASWPRQGGPTTHCPHAGQPWGHQTPCSCSCCCTCQDLSGPWCPQSTDSTWLRGLDSHHTTCTHLLLLLRGELLLHHGLCGALCPQHLARHAYAAGRGAACPRCEGGIANSGTRKGCNAGGCQSTLVGASKRWTHAGNSRQEQTKGRQ